MQSKKNNDEFDGIIFIWGIIEFVDSIIIVVNVTQLWLNNFIAKTIFTFLYILFAKLDRQTLQIVIHIAVLIYIFIKQRNDS